MKYEKVEVNSERWFDLTSLLNEEFRDIVGYEGHYQISNYGRVKALERVIIHYNGFGTFEHKYKEKIKIVSKQCQGYLMVTLCKNCKQKRFLVHRLVAEAFIPNPNNLPEVNHKNAIKNDNRLENLEWCTRLYNQQEAEQLGLVKSPMRIIGKGHPSNKKTLRLDSNGKIVKEYYSITNAGQDIGVSMKHISYCIIHNIPDKKTHSYWKYKEEN